MPSSEDGAGWSSQSMTCFACGGRYRIAATAGNLDVRDTARIQQSDTIYYYRQQTVLTLRSSAPCAAPEVA